MDPFSIMPSDDDHAPASEPSLLNTATPDSPVPRVQLLSNGNYHVMLTQGGGGFSQWGALAVTRWREDSCSDRWGSFCYVADTASGQVWSATEQPLPCRDDIYTASFPLGHAVFHRDAHGIHIRTEVAVDRDADVEIRRVHLRNHSAEPRSLDITSYAEIVLTPAATDSAHPAFEKLFVETEILPALHAIVCTRRARATDEPAPSMFHRMNAAPAVISTLSYETDRARFIGRGRDTSDPRALDAGQALSGFQGAALDPVVALRCRVDLAPGAATVIDLVFGVGQDRAACLALAGRYPTPAPVTRVLAQAADWHTQVLQALGCDKADGARFASLASHLLYASAALRAEQDVLLANDQDQSALWRHGISGDLPIAVVQVSTSSQLPLVRQMLCAQAYWRLNGLVADLVVLAQKDDTLLADIRTMIAEIAARRPQAAQAQARGAVFVLLEPDLPDANRVALLAAARVSLHGDAGSLADQLRLHPAPLGTSATPQGVSWRAPANVSTPSLAALPQSLQFDNGLGGFSNDGRQYIMHVSKGKTTPMPWVNVIANPTFGTLVSESGSATTWRDNAQMYRLSPWSNDPISDANTEAFYIRDEENGVFWSPTLQPAGDALVYRVRHGFGFSVFEHTAEGIVSELTLFVAIDAPVKFAALRLTNRSGRVRHLSVTGYVEWVLGDEREKTAMHVGTAIDSDTGALLARNPFSLDFGAATAFFDTDGAADPQASASCDRLAFLGHGGSLRQPAAMMEPRLNGAAGAGLDPCAALRIPVTLADEASHETVFRLGAGATQEEARQLAQLWRGADKAHQALAAVKQHWTRTLASVQVQTPDPSFDLLANGWLAYQTLACRLWARNAFYQSSGAFGYRDQLQDVMALVYAAPDLVRAHLLRCAARQFEQGDAQHWWHPPSGRGVRTRCSDDYLWLPLATVRYIDVTGDTGVLDETVSYLRSDVLAEGQASRYELPAASQASATLYTHCVRAVEHGLRFGRHGLPLMGTGDWNDGMNLVGAAGQGESVWLGFFLHQVLAQFGKLARQQGDTAFAERCGTAQGQLETALDQSAWDGAWYRRGWFDDGSPLGTAANAECRIDSIAQSWAVLSGAADPPRARAAMDAVDAQLIDRQAAVVRLLDPPFDHSDPSPGYIQGYLRGVRENGGQYTHAAVWAAMAYAELKDVRRAWEMFTLLNPIRHADSPEGVARYQVEPYVIASDVYAFAPHAGRGGWTWYSGSAGWMLRFMLESLLGLRVQADQLRLEPCCPQDWASFQLRYRYRDTLYTIQVQQRAEAIAGSGWRLDGVPCPVAGITLVDDHRDHAVQVQFHASGESQCNSA